MDSAGPIFRGAHMVLAVRYFNGHNFCTGASFLGPLALSQDVLSFAADQEKARILKNNKKKTSVVIHDKFKCTNHLL